MGLLSAEPAFRRDHWTNDRLLCFAARLTHGVRRAIPILLVLAVPSLQAAEPGLRVDRYELLEISGSPSAAVFRVQGGLRLAAEGEFIAHPELKLRSVSRGRAVLEVFPSSPEVMLLELRVGEFVDVEELRARLRAARGVVYPQAVPAGGGKDG